MKRFFVTAALVLGLVVGLEAAARVRASLTGTTCAADSSGIGCVMVGVTDDGGVGIQVQGTWVATLEFEGSLDQTTGGLDCQNWVPISAFPPNSTTAASSTMANGTWVSNIAGLRCVRVRASSYTSGTAIVTLQSSRGSAEAGGGVGGSLSAGASSTTEVLFNCVGAVCGDAGLTYNAATDTPTATGPYLTGTVSTTVPGFSFVGDADTGFGADSADRLVFITGGTRKWLLSSTALFPLTDNAMDFGASGNRIQNVFIGTSLRTGTAPASSGALRLSYGSGINARNQSLDADIGMFGVGQVADDDYVEFGDNQQHGVSKPLGLKFYPGSATPMRLDATTGLLQLIGPYVTAGSGMAVANVGADSCGTTAATIAGNNNAGAVTVGATSGTQCRVTTTITAPARWHCSASNETTANLARCVHVDTTHFDLIGVFVAGDVVSYVASPR